MAGAGLAIIAIAIIAMLAIIGIICTIAIISTCVTAGPKRGEKAAGQGRSPRQPPARYRCPPA